MRAAAVLSTLCVVLSGTYARADEKIAPPSYWVSQGYSRVSLPPARDREIPSWAPHSLSWPVPFEDPQHSLGNSMTEFQDYGDGPYFHGGLDLRVKAGQTVLAPVDGRIEAGHYGYSNNPDGSMTKYWTPWPGNGDTHYFEVAVITDDGYRFEHHHMDETSLPSSIITALQHGGGRIHAGELLGATIVWPDGVYHHTHLNVITPSGVRLNPEYYFELIPDHVAPEIQAAAAVYPGGKTADFGNGQFASRPDHFSVVVVDHKDSDSYVQPPVYASVKFDSGASAGWDFRERLLGPDGKFPSIWSFFEKSVAIGAQSWDTSGGYGDGISIIQVPVPPGAKGAFTIEIADGAGNSSELHGTIAP